ncbi:MAG: DUF3089 domain-containing protein, partial [Bacteroidota bacterium]
VMAFLLSLPVHAQVYDTTNYHDSSNWAAHPMKGLADMHFLPDYTFVGPDTLPGSVINIDYDTTSGYDVFCIYPTTAPYIAVAQNFAICDSQKTRARAALWEYNQYTQFGRIYAPYYRQASLAAIALPHLLPGSRQKQADILDTAVTDVIGAYDYYIKHDNHGKKVILLGHSQGAIMLALMLRKMETDTVKFQTHLDRIFLAVLVGMECGPYVAKDSLTGGWWQTIPICQNPLDTDCVMSWATNLYGMPFTSVKNDVSINEILMNKGYLYSTLDTSIHEVKMDPLNYIPPTDVSLSVYPLYCFGSHDYDVSTRFIGYTNMYHGSIENPDAANYGLMIERLTVPNDYRYNPLDSADYGDCHKWDMYVSQGDVIDLIWQKINQTTTSIPFSENTAGDDVQIFPNPVSDLITINLSPDFCKKDAIIEIFSADGQLIKKQEFPQSETLINVSGLSQGIYILKIISGKSVFANKIVIN